MKKSHLKKEIKEYIVEILSEADLDTTAGSVVMPKTSNPADIKKLTDKNIDVQLKEEDEDREPTKAELEKEKVKGAPSKFKVPQSDFEDFKTKLKTLVKKIKDMEKGEERDRKMAALKQFIKKPELIKAFKERDVKIDTDGLIGENKMMDKTILGKQVDPEFDIFTYDHLLPKGTGDDFTPKQFNQMLNAAKMDASMLKQQGKKIKIEKDDNGLPYLEIL
jgi:hypothetical protein